MLTRRNFMLLGAAAGAYGLVSKIPTARAAEARPHFLLSIQIQPGVDWTYLFDARSPKVTEKNLQQNYLLRNEVEGGTAQPELFTEARIRERTIVCEQTNSTALRYPVVNELWDAHKDRLSVVNGVYMLRDNAGHLENSAYLFGNTASGGAPIYPPMVGKRLGGVPLETVLLRDFLQIFPPPSNLAGSADLSIDDLSALSQSLATGPQIDESSPTWQYLLDRCDANAAAGGLFGGGAANLGFGLRRAKATSKAFADSAPDPNGDPNMRLVAGAKQALTFFSAGLTKVATLVFTENTDTHDPTTASVQGVTYAGIANQIKTIIDLLKTTMFTDARGNATPFIDLTTFVISSEFGRTTRSLGFGENASVGTTGTDHNPLTNSALVGGKGIVGGLIVGESDLRDCDDEGKYTSVSGAHRQKNGTLDQVMGKPFDFQAQRTRTDLPDVWREADHILMPSVTNTILDAFDVPPEEQFKVGGQPAPILSVLRSRGR